MGVLGKNIGITIIYHLVMEDLMSLYLSSNNLTTT